MKDWKTYAIIILAAWCAYLSWRVTPAIVHRAYDYNHMSYEDVYWWNGERAEDMDESLKVRPDAMLRKRLPTASKTQ